MSITTQELGKNEIYTFWRSLPLIKKVPEDKFEQVQQETRSKIIEILRTGIDDTYSEFTRRYALNAQEIQDILTKEGIKTSLQNIYFHINILLEEGFIQEIAILKEGRFNKRYYGRTAKLFLFVDFHLNKQEKYDEAKNKLISLINIVNGKTQEDEVHPIIEKYLNEQVVIINNYDEIVNSWFEKNAEKFIEYNIDVKETYQMILEIVSSQTQIGKKMLEILKI